MQTRVDGVKRRFTLGDDLTLAQARAKAKTTAKSVGEGHDPTAERRARRIRKQDALDGVGTLDSVIELYFSIGDGRGLKSGTSQKEHLQRVFKPCLTHPALDLKVRDLQLAIDAWPSRSSARHAVAYARKLFRWARKRELIGDGFSGIEAPERDKDIEQRRLSVEETEKFLRALSDRPHDIAAQAMLWTAARREEIAGATWREFELNTGTWTIPGARRKNTRGRRSKNAPADHVIQLPKQMVEMLRPLAAKADDLVFSTDGAPLQNWPRWAARISKRACIETVPSPHCLRRTASTRLGDLREFPHVVEAVLGHRSIGGALHAGYNAARYADEVGEALQRLADYYDRLTSDKPNVVEFKRP